MNILILEDEPAHAEAIRRAFEAADLKAVVQIAGTLREFQEIVAVRRPDIVLMDMILPDGRALDALALLPEACCPILIMTSHGNEQMAVEAMKAGALDYIVKSPEAFIAMPHAVERALREWNVLQGRKRAEAALRESEERFRVLYENSTLGLYMTTPDGRIILANPALVKMLGYSSFDDLSGRDLRTEGFEPGYPREQFVESVEKENGIVGLESAWKRRDGTTVFVRESARAIRGPEGQIVYFDGTVEDVTIRKKAEEKLAYEQNLLRALMENATDQVYFKDRDSCFIRISKAQADRFGLSDPAQAEHKSDFDFFDEEHARQAFLDEQEVMKTGRPLVDLEEKESTPSGREAWVSTTKVPLRDKQGKILGTFGISRDITERKRAQERDRLARDVLGRLNQREGATDTIQDILRIVKMSTGIEAVGIRLREGDDFPYFETNGFLGHFVEMERSLCARDAAGQLVRDAKGNPELECMCGNIIRGRTDPKLPFFTERGSFWTNGTTELLATTTEKDRQRPTRNRCNGEGFESVALIPLRTGDEIIGLLQLNDHRKDQFTPDTILFFEGLGASIGIALSRVQAEAAVRKSEAELSSALRMAHAGYWEYDVATDTFTFNDNFYRIFRTTAAEVGGYRMSSAEYARRFCHPDAAAIVANESRAAVESADPNYSRQIEHRFLYADGEVGTISVRFFVNKDAHGRTVKTYGVNQDITERKRLEQAQRQAEENFRRSLDESPLGARIVTEEGTTIYANKVILDLYGFGSLEELNATPLKDRYSPQTYAEFQNRNKQRSNGTFPSEYEISIVRKNGEIRVLHVFRKEVLWNGRNHYQALYLDVTERKAAEERLNKTLQSLSLAMAATIRVLGLTVEARDPYTAGHQQKTTSLAEAIAREMGLSSERVAGLHMAGLVHDIGKISIPAEILSKPTKLTPGEYALVQTHAKKGYEILKDVKFPWPLAEIVYQHHERMDGSGYPRGLKGDEILMEARILCVADTMEAMASHRPYRPALGPKPALAEIEKGKGVLYDADVAETCLKLFRERRFSFPA
jgi:PAS domain S-box-containing protein/putative nucleotidyltransferase with HDIG domain